ncbi:Ig-like domain-containing protein [Ketobacter alkanivorans]|uniref:Ig-like domain-containing protein n=1 Tax=Ketobacter alkanivorans TaxID=1917421 RepID=A0A2K9LG72_9GAMM|nr:Ig-like domain-containing protein [Ketobacter alkanivorans]AUM11349.1 hypothetical protein Kalk_02410 [Ketobacter alkanivorans]
MSQLGAIRYLVVLGCILLITACGGGGGGGSDTRSGSEQTESSDSGSSGTSEEDNSSEFNDSESGDGSGTGNVDPGNEAGENTSTSDYVAPAVVSLWSDDVPFGEGRVIDDTVAFSGTGEPGHILEFWLNGVMNASTVVDSRGEWRIDFTVVTLIPDRYEVNLVTVSPSGESVASASTFTFRYDPTAPASPIISAITDDSYVAGDGFTTDGTLVITGMAEPSMTVTLYLNSVAIGTSIADGEGNWSVDYSAVNLSDGSYMLTADSTFLTLQSAISPQFPVVIDRVPPAAPSVLNISLDSGLSATDYITNDTRLVFDGVSEPFAQIRLRRDATVLGNTTADASGNWSFDYSVIALSEGAHSVQLMATDRAGNQSAWSSLFNLMIDTAAPNPIGSIALQPDTGVIGDGVTATGAIQLVGTADAGDYVEVFFDGSSVGQVLVDSSGDWILDLSAAPLVNGNYSVTTQVVDLAGNQSSVSPGFDIVINALPPSMPVISGITTDTGLASDGITADSTLEVLGTADAGADVYVYIDGVGVGVTTADMFGNWSFDHTATVLTDGVHILTAQAENISGLQSPMSVAFNLVIDTAAPVVPAITAISPDTGIVGDGITSANGIVLSGASDPNNTLYLYQDAVLIGQTVSDGAGNWSYDHSSIALVDGTYSFLAVAEDVAGNRAASAVYAITIDTATPAAPAVTAITDDTGTASDGITSGNQLVISGTAEANSSVEVFVDAASIGTTIADGSGNWSYDHTGTTLADGSYTITATATDTSGNASAASGAFNITVDTGTPAAPAVTAITTDTGTAGDGITSDNTLAISGTAEANAAVEVFIDAGSIGTTTADGSGNWSYDHTGTTLADGSYAVTATATDTSGNASVASGAFNITVDTGTPAAPAVTAISTDTGTNNDQITSDTTLVFSGTAEANATVEVFIDAASIGTASADGSGNWSYDHTGTTLSAGSYSITATAQDLAGNTSVASSALSVTVDTAAPAAPAVTAITDDTGTASDGITSDNQLVISGTAEANATVEVFIDAGSIGTTTADGSGNWSYDHTGTTLADGSYAITATATDTSGNASAASSAFNITVDTGAPGAPSVTAITADTGTAGDGITSDNTLVISGTAEANATVEVFIDAASIGTASADGSGNWSYDHTGTTLSAGSYSITATAQDLAGNTSVASSALSVTVDTAAPAAPAVTAITDDTGTAADGVTSDNQLVITGTAEANSSVEVFIDAGSIGTTTADGSGNWSYDHTGTTLADGSYAITATATDTSGNASVASSAFNVTVDTGAPGAPSVTAITTDTGTAADGITSDNTLVFTGTAEASASIEVFIDAGSIGSTTADGSGNWSYDHTGTTLADGSYAITATATDTSGNASAASSAFNIAVDTGAPGAPSVTAITMDTGTAADGITSDNTLAISGTAEANASIEVFIDAGSIGTTTADGSGNWSYDHTGTTLADGSYSVTASATDTSGNVSATSSALSITVDTGTPAAPAVTEITSDTGTNNDQITSDTTLVFSGTAEANAAVEVFIDAGSIGTTTADGSGNWSYDHTGTTLADGSYAVTATATDTSGNASVASSAFNITVDTGAPGAPSVTAITTDTGTAADGVTSDNTLVISGSAEANAAVEVFVDAASIGTASADGSGNWSYDHTGTTLADGSYAITATATDTSGNASVASSAFNITVDAGAPGAPSVTAITTDTGTAADGVTSDNTLVISGTAEANAAVEVFIDAASIGTASADGSGNWSYDHTGTTLADGSYAITATATDTSGNASAASGAFNITVDTGTPAAPAVTAITSDTGTNNDQITSDTTLVFSGTAEASSSVEVFVDAASIGTASADGSGNWSYDHTGTTLSAGSYSITATAQDLAGNTSVASSALSVTVDTAAPAAPAVTAITDDTGTAADGVTSDNQLVITGTAEANSSVEVFIDAGSIGTTTADGSGNWSYDHTGTTLADGSYAITATATDTSGNASVASSAFNVTVDTGAPGAPSVTAITTDTGTAADGITSDNTLVFTGTAEASASIEVFIDAGSIGSTTADGSGNWSYDHTGTTLADGSYAITATATDTSGNASAASSAFNIAVDTGAPGAPSVTAITMDTGTAADGITSDNTLAISGTAEANASIEVFIDAGSIGTTTADGSGNWSYDHTGTTLADGSYSVTASATDTSGNVSATSSALSITVDTGTPAAPAVTEITSDTGTNNDQITSDTTLVFSGTAEANAAVEVFIDAGSIGTTTADGSGNWSYDHTGTTLADGSYAVTATATDTSGNASVASSAFNITVDTGAPGAPSVTAITTDTGTAADGVTSDNTLVISGSAEANAAVEVFVDAASIGTASADGSGNWSYDHTGTTLADGSYAITATATDTSGNASVASSAFNITVDTGAPGAPSVTAITTDTGTAADGVTSDNTLVISGTAEANAAVEVFIDAASIGTASADGSGNWSYDHTGTTLADGSYAITATATDTSGNASAASGAFNITVDTGTPAAPAVTAITSDTGTNNDQITSDTTLVFSGTAEASSSVEVFVDAASIGTASADGSGNWSYDHTGTTLSAGSYSITATAQDLAGNTSVASSALSVMVDTAAPAAPAVTAITDDTGTASDGVTSDNQLVISGTAEANATVEVFIDAVSIGTTTADGSGNWSYDHTGSTLAEGGYSLTAQSTDGAGNSSAVSAGFAITIDTSAPAAPSVTAITMDTGTAADGVTSDNSLVISGTAEANASIEVFIDAGSIGTTTADGSGNWSYDHTGTTLADGSYAITATATDTSGNASAASSAFNVTVDTGTPAAPSVTVITTDTGTAGDGITSDNTLAISGTAEANTTVEVFIDAGSIGTTTADGSGNWSYDHTGSTLADGSYAITATATDTSGNASVASSAFNVTVDTGAPGAPSVTAITTDTGTAADGITSDNTLVISGTAEANAAVEVFIDAGSIGTTTADGSGNWSYDHTGSTLADGSYAITATATDTSGNASVASSAFNVTVDTGAPGAPSVTAITTDTGTAGDGITSDNTLVISGTAEANATVEVFVDAGSIGTTTADGSGNWSYDHTGTTLADGSYAITATATDTSGNASAASSAFNITVDTGTPAAPAVTAITSDTGTNNDQITSDTTLVFSGTAEANATVEVFIDAGSIGTTTADGSGNWSYDHTGATLADGSYAVTATATDTSGNASVASSAFNITVDTGAPGAPSVTAITTDTGTAADGVTSDNTLVFTGTAEANATVEVFIDAGSIGTTTADGSGNWSYNHTGTTLADGSYAVTATATDTSGNASVASGAFNITVDTGTPAAPAVTAISTDTGTNNDQITSDTTLVFSGTAEASSSVEVFVDAASIGTASADGSGNWSYDHTGTTLSAGSYSITATAQDLAGNTSVASSALSVTVDTAAPAAPAVTAITDDTGTASDGITSDNTLVFTGTAEVNADVEVFIDAGSIGTTTADGSGNWSYDHTGTTLADGSYAITATSTDTSGNASAASTAFNITVDTGTPAAPAVTAITTDTGTAGDGITSDNTLAISGTAEANATVEVFVDAGSIGTTTADGSGNWSYDHTGTTLADGSYAITATATDTSGNASAASSAFNITVDTGAPGVPSVTAITTDTGTAADGVTSDNTLVLSGTAEANASIEVFIDAGSIGTTTADGSGNWSYDHTGTTLADGSYAITATATDTSGNDSAASSAFNITVDTGTPAAPAVTAITSDTGTNNDQITSDTTLVFSGTAEANATVEVFVDAASIGTASADGSGNWSYDHTGTTLSAGSYSITATAQDLAGNTSVASSALSVTVDTAAPAAPAVTAITDDTGTAADGVTSDNQLVITGTAEANSSVEVFIDAGSIGTTTADGSGNWSYDHTGTTLADGSYAITATATDTSGNASVASGAFNITVDTGTPAAPAVTAITTDTGTAADGVTSDNSLVISGTAEANASIEVFIDAGSIGTTTADGSGNWSYDHTGSTLADGSYAVTATATDTSGNASAASSAFNITVDTGAPGAPSVTAITTDTGTAADGVTSDNSLVISGTAEANASIEVFIDAGSIGTTTADGSGNWSYDHTGSTLADGSYAVTATATDTSGNASAASSAFNITVDTGAPGAPSVTAITTDTGNAADGITSDNTLVFTGTAEANATVEVFIDAGSIGTTTADGSGNWSYDHTGTTLADGSYAITATATDTSGNASVASGAFNITVDTGTPAAPAVTAITSDTGTNNDQITSDTTLVFSGTAEANATVEVFIDAASIGTASADGSGNWSYDHTGTTLSADSYSITATAQDLAGNTSVASSALSVTVDTAAPAAPAVTAITDDTGTASDGVTSDNQLVISGTAEANASIEVFIDAGSIGTTAADGSGNWSYDHTGTTLADGSYAVTATATDTSGNASVASGAFNITVDTGTPAAPFVTAITSDTGTNNDQITSDTTLVFSGTAEANATVEVFIDAASIGTASADGSGNWSYDHTGTTLSAGSYSITATAQDLAGNTSVASSALSVTVDTAAPAAPAVTAITDDTGTASDGVTSDNQLVISGTAEVNATVEVFIDAGSIGTTTADGSGNWSYDHTGTTLADGSYAITATATDTSGNASVASGAFNITVDTGTPAAPAVTAITTDTGIAGDGITSDNTLAISGTAEANATVEVFIDAASIGTASADGSGNWSYDHTGTTLSAGSYSITATAQDLAGNTSVASSAMSVTVDTAAPAAPAVTAITDDTGTASDGVTSDNQLVISGTAEANATVEVFIDAGSIGSTTADGSGNWSYDHTGTTLSDNTYAITAVASDNAANASATSSTFNVTVDTVAPAVSSYTPANGATGVAFASNLTMTFADNVYVATGNLVLRRYLDDTIVETIDITSGQVTGTGTTTLTINPTSDLVGGRQYYVEVDAGALIDLAGNSYAGISGNSTWAFTTLNTALTSTTPADEATGVALNTDLTFVFNEAVTANVGNIVIKRVSDDVVFETIDVAVATITGDGTTSITVSLSDTLAPNTAYYVEIDAGAFINTDSAAYAGISGNSTLNFTTVNVSIPTVTNVTSSLANGTYRGGDTVPIQIVFSEAVDVTGTPRIYIDLDGSDKYVNYTSGTGTTTLQFDYSVVTGDSTSDLGYVSAASLSLNGGTIRSANLANATLTLPSPGAANSLSNNKNIVITAASLDITNLTPSDGFFIEGYEVGDWFARSVGGGGDSNGDGFEDIVIGVAYSDISAGDAGAAYVIFGAAGATRSDIQVNSLAATDGFLIYGTDAADFLGMTVDLTGDLNGDGYDEIVVVASHDDTSVADGGTIYVIWGEAGATRSDIDLSAMGPSDGFRILSHEVGDAVGNTSFIDPQNAQFLDADGDFNGDGIDDLIIGHSASDQGGGDSGLVYVIFGQTGATRSDVDLSSYAGQGFEINTGGVGGELLGHSVQFIGDFNGDGFNDLVVGAVRSDAVAGDAGQAYVIFGHAGPTFNNIDLTAMTNTEGFTISTSEAASWLGGSVGSSDVNGDGLSDVLIGNVASNTGYGDSGSILVLYGYNSATYADMTFGSVPIGSGFTIYGEGVSDFFSHAVEGVGDVNGDGVDDIMATSWVDDEGGGDAGAAWIIYGVSGASRADVQLNTLDSSDGFKIIGDRAVDYFGMANAVADLNGDGYQDLVVASRQGDNGAADAGEVNVIWGKDFLSLVDSDLTGTAGADYLVGTSGDDTIAAAGGADAVSAGAGDDTIQVADLSFVRVDGGRGEDTLELTGTGLSLDLRVVNYEVIRGIEVINLADNGNGLSLDKPSLLALSDEARILYVNGGSSDWVFTDAGETWTPNGSAVVNTITYDRYDNGEASLYIQDVLSQPVTPSAPAVTAFANDTGVLSDNITSDTGLVFSGTTGAYFDVEVFIDAGSIGTTTADASGNWSYDYSGTALSDGTYAITAQATNLSGYVSAASSALNVTVDASAPAAPAVTAITTDTGNNSDGITNDNTLVVSGTAEANSTVTVFVDAGSIGTTTASGGGAWSYDYTGTIISDGSYVLTATASDTAGNTSAASSAFNITIDSSTPSAPSVTSISSDTGTGGDGVTSDNTLIFSGTSEANATVEVFIGAGSIGTTTASGGGSWSYDYTGTTLSDGSYAITATAADTAGNTSAASSAFNITVDTAGPSVSTLSPTDGNTSVAYTSNLVIVFGETVTVGTGNIVIYNGGGSVFETIPVGDARVTGSGSNTITINPSGTFVGGSDYYVQIAAGTFADGLGNTYGGIADTTTWNFTTVPTQLSATIPADEATGIDLDAGLTLTFNEAVTVNSGDLRIRQLSDDTLIETIDVTSGQVTGSGSAVISVARSAVLDPVTAYYVEIDSGAFRNANSVAFTGISDNSTWNFTTKFVTTPTVTNVTSSTANGTYRGGDQISIQVTFSELVNVTISGGKPRLRLSLNAGDIYVSYTSGTGTTTLTFNYTVALGDTTSDLAYASTTSLELNGGVIRSADYANANLTLPSPGASGSLNANKAIVLSGATTLDVTFLRAEDGFFITGAETSTVYFGHSISSGGDFNGDGFEDLAIGVPDSNLSNTSGGFAYLVYGKAGATRSGIAMTSLSASDGFEVDGADTADYAGSVVDISGDLNGDGYDDMIVVASRADDGATTGGNIYVIWGNGSPSGINLSSDFNRTSGFTNSKGFVITGHESSDEIGMYNSYEPNNAQFIDASGDFNGDGINDLLIGHEQGDENATNGGYVYVIFGQSGATRANFRLDAYATHGFRVYSSETGAHVGRAQYLGDYNGDGYSDVMIGAPGVSSDDGEAYVVFGNAGPTFSNIDLAALNGTNGFAISTTDSNAWLGGSLGAADVNGDGLSDLIVGAPSATYASRTSNGAAMVIYGTSSAPHSDLTLETLPAARGYVIYGEDSGEESSYTAQGVRDINGDGVDDIMLSSGKDDDAGTNAGAAWVIFGITGTSRGDIDLSSLSASTGFKISGDTSDDRFGQSATSGDMNGDGYQDIMVSSVAGDNAGSFSGEVNVIWGQDFLGAVDVSGEGTSADENLIGTDGDDTVQSGGGLDAIRTGSGDDIVEIEDVNFFDIDGGLGTDTILFTTSLNTFDLTSIGEESISDIEVIDLADSGNVLTVSRITVLGLSKETSILYVKGGSSDAVVSSGSDAWVNTGSATVGGVDYDIYEDNGAFLYIENTVDATAVP